MNNQIQTIKNIYTPQDKKTKRSKISQKRKKELIFVTILLAYPLIQFLATWIFVNSYSIILAFQNVTLEGETSFVGFANFGEVIKRFFDPNYGHTLLPNGAKLPNNLLVFINSLGYGLITIFISLPLAMLSSYFLSKKMPFANVFRVIFFLPNIISTIALIYAFRMQTIDPVAGFLTQLGINIADWPETTIIVFVYCIWAGLGYNILLLSGAIGRVPKELFESAQMDGAGNWQQFIKIMVPMVWPTVVTLVITGLSSILTLYLQPMLMELPHNETIAGAIFNGVATGQTNQYPYFSAFGLLFSFIFAPAILLIRKVISRKYSETEC